jgi:hypothetical protein
VDRCGLSEFTAPVFLWKVLAETIDTAWVRRGVTVSRAKIRFFESGGVETATEDSRAVIRFLERKTWGYMPNFLLQKGENLFVRGLAGGKRPIYPKLIKTTAVEETASSQLPYSIVRQRRVIFCKGLAGEGGPLVGHAPWIAVSMRDSGCGQYPRIISMVDQRTLSDFPGE